MDRCWTLLVDHWAEQSHLMMTHFVLPHFSGHWTQQKSWPLPWMSAGAPSSVERVERVETALASSLFREEVLREEVEMEVGTVGLAFFSAAAQPREVLREKALREVDTASAGARRQVGMEVEPALALSLASFSAAPPSCRSPGPGHWTLGHRHPKATMAWVGTATSSG